MVIASPPFRLVPKDSFFKSLTKGEHEEAFWEARQFRMLNIPREPLLRAVAVEHLGNKALKIKATGNWSSDFFMLLQIRPRQSVYIFILITGWIRC
jgi:hypothetical protein